MGLEDELTLGDMKCILTDEFLLLIDKTTQMFALEYVDAVLRQPTGGFS